ncbi:SusC/RagA family TonB-linked outer membrane protein [Parapedobacter sp.]
MNRKLLSWLILCGMLTLLYPVFGQSTDYKIVGKVTDAETGTAVAGVSVVHGGTAIATKTGSDGQYVLNVPNLDGMLSFSHIGFRIAEVPISNRTTIDVALEKDVTALDQIVVIGYGTQERKDLTGSIASVSAEEIKNQPAASIDQMLQGKAAGVTIAQSSGAPGGRVNIRIRGASSINAGNEPLFVIDGIPVYNSSKDPSGTSYDTFTPTNALASLNPNDIESVEVLKDASATAIYGSRGSNGVVIITTKRGKGGVARVNYTGYYGTQQLARKLDLMNGQEHARFLNDWAGASGLNQPFPDPDAIGEGTDWQEEVFRTAPIQNHQVSVSSASSNTKYYISGNYFNQQGIALNSGLERYAIRVNVDNKLSDKITFSQSLTFNRTINRSVPTNSAGGDNIRSVADKVYATSPTIPVFDENGVYVDNWYGSTKAENPVAAIKTIQNRLRGDNLLGNVSLDYDIIKGLAFKTLLGVNLMNRANEEYYPRETTYIGGLLGGLGVISDRRITNLLNENILRYTKTFNQVHDLEVMGGFTWQTEKIAGASTQPSGFPDDRLGVNSIGSATNVPEVASSRSGWSLASWLGRINYQYNQKFLFTATFRADGSSKFGSGNKWGYFPSVALGYRLSEEAFNKSLNVIDDLKIRASYGLTGNQEIGSYQSLARLVTSDIYIIDNQLVSGASQAGLANRELRWEKASQWDVGIDLSMFGNRLRLVADYYTKNTTDLLFTVNLPAYSGFSSALYNTGGLQNKGLELSLGGDILTGMFTWSVSANYSQNHTEVTSLGRSASTTLFIGYAPGAIRGYLYDGVFHNQGEIDGQTAQKGVEPGDARYRDVNGDGELNADDRVILGNPLPDDVFGFHNHFSYKGITLSVSLQGEMGMDSFNSISSFDPSTGSSNKSRKLLNRWTPENSDSNVPRAGVRNWFANSSYMLEDRSYIKIRNVQLGYDLPVSVLPWAGRANIYLSGQNLVTFTSFPGYDPDGGRHYPTARTIIFGVNLGF